MKADFSSFLQTLSAQKKRLYVRTLLLSLVSSIVQSFGYVLLLPILSLLGIGEQTDLPWIDVWPIEVRLMAVTFLFVLIQAMAAMIIRWSNLSMYQVTQTTVADYKNRLHEAVMNAEYLVMSQMKRQDIIHLVTTELARIANAHLVLLRTLANVFVLAVTVLTSLVISWKITGIVLLSSGLVGLAVLPIVRQSKQFGMKNLESLKSMNKALHDHLYGYKSIKYARQEEASKQRFRLLSEQIVRQFMRYHQTQEQIDLSYRLAAAGVLGVLVVSSGLLVEDPGRIAVLVVLFTRLWPATVSLQKSIQEWMVLSPSITAYHRVLNDLENHARTTVFNAIPMRLNAEIQLEGVSFSYPNGPETVNVAELSFEAHRMTVITGTSGSGKSTLLDVLSGLILPDKGLMRVDGHAIDDMNRGAYRAMIGVISAEDYLINGTIRDNITLFTTASDEVCWNALERAGLKDRVGKLEEQLDYLVGDGGTRLSAGERQRLLIARSIVNFPQILLVDEATNALDINTEAAILGMLKGLLNQITLIMVAHREQVMQAADRVIVIDKGHVVESGSYSDLKLKNDSYLNRVVNP